jgi:hypothetical protein
VLVTGIVDGGIEFTSLDAVFVARAASVRWALTFTDRFEFESSLPDVTKYMSPNSTITPRITTGATTHGGIESVFG